MSPCLLWFSLRALRLSLLVSPLSVSFDFISSTLSLVPVVCLLLFIVLLLAFSVAANNRLPVCRCWGLWILSTALGLVVCWCFCCRLCLIDEVDFLVTKGQTRADMRASGTSSSSSSQQQQQQQHDALLALALAAIHPQSRILVVGTLGLIGLFRASVFEAVCLLLNVVGAAVTELLLIGAWG